MIRAVKAVLPTRASVTEKSATSDITILEISVQVGSTPTSHAGVLHSLSALWVGEGWPKQVRAALSRETLPDVIVGRHISPGAREYAATRRVGWIEESGAAEFVTESGLVIRTEPKVINASTSQLRASGQVVNAKWTPAALATAEALLMGAKGTVASIEDATGLSTGACVRALRALTDFQLLTANAKRGRNAERRVANLDSLLNSYRAAAHVHRAQLPASFSHLLWRNPLEFILDRSQLWNASGIKWAATGALAAQQTAPYLTDVQSVEIYVDGPTTSLELDNVAGIVGGQPSTTSGARLILRPFPTTTSLRHVQQHNDLPVVPLPRLYADLFDVGVRGGEAAEHLREVTGLGRTEK